MRPLLLAALALVASACGGTPDATTATTPDTIPTPTGAPLPEVVLGEGELVRHRLIGGECDRCDHDLVLRDDGSASLRSSRGDVDTTYDAARLRALLASFDPASFVIGEADCGREVDGNAPILTAAGVEIDLCLWQVDPTHPLPAFVDGVLDDAVADRDASSGTTIPSRPDDGAAGAIAEVVLPTVPCGDLWCPVEVSLFADGRWTRRIGDEVLGGEFAPDELLAAVSVPLPPVSELGRLDPACPYPNDEIDIRFRLFDPVTGAVVHDSATCGVDLAGDHPLFDALADPVGAPMSG